MPVLRMVDRFPELIVAAGSETEAALDKAAADIETGAMERSRVDTGTMRGGWTSLVVNRWSRMVYNPVYYTIFNEFGTINMGAQPMLQPAMEEVTPHFIEAVRHAWYG